MAVGTEVDQAEFADATDFGVATRGKREFSTALLLSGDDREAVRIWLAEYANSPNTFINYRKEARRLLRWCASIGKPLAELSREDLLAYREFMANPQPADDWIGPPVPFNRKDVFDARGGLIQKGWRPFSKPLNEGSIATAFSALQSLFSYFHKSGRHSHNPLSYGRNSKSGSAAAEVVRLRVKRRYLDRTMWAALVNYLDAMPRANRRQIDHAERARWLIHLFYLAMPRRFEVAYGHFGQMYCVENPLARNDATQPRDVWMWRIEGKGGKPREVPVLGDLESAMIRYRTHLGLTPYPSTKEETPLALTITGEGRTGSGRHALGERAILRVVKQICQNASDTLRLKDPDRADRLEVATTHWLRHTGATHLLEEQADIRVVADMLGHGSLNTTMIYQHVGEVAKMRAAASLHVRRDKDQTGGEDGIAGST